MSAKRLEASPHLAKMLEQQATALEALAEILKQTGRPDSAARLDAIAALVIPIVRTVRQGGGS